jgi:predicted DNA-binding transcriptional regulator AlpA
VKRRVRGEGRGHQDAQHERDPQSHLAPVQAQRAASGTISSAACDELRPVFADEAKRAPTAILGGHDAQSVRRNAAPGWSTPEPSLASVTIRIALLMKEVSMLADFVAKTSGGGLALLAQPEAVMPTGTNPMATTKLTLTQTETAEWLGIDIRTLQRRRAAGEGPRAIKIGRAVRYRRRDVERWLEGKRS